MNKLLLTLVFILSATTANASSLTTLSIATGNASPNSPCTSGSCFSMEVAPGFLLYNNMTGYRGIIINTIQPSIGSHSGAPNGTENPNIDVPWNYHTNTGMHQTNFPTTVLSRSGNTATLDFSGWAMTWNGIPSINLGSGASNGVAAVVCAVDCTDGDSYTLTYAATVPNGSPSGFGSVSYTLTLRGAISGNALATPIPAAVWLFGSGLIGLLSIARRKK